MVPQFDFTKIAMMTALEGTTVTYEDLENLDREFDDVETEILRSQVKLSRPLYEKRQKTVSHIADFWRLVFEQAPPEIDEYIQPSDSHLLMTSLKSLFVERFEVDDAFQGEPRSISFRLEFLENEHFEDTVIEKKFWYRRSKDGWAGLVSEPVDIKWKPGKDLTNGLLSLAKKAYDEEQAREKETPGKKDVELTPSQKLLKAQLDNTGLGGMSFFNWFGYIGNRVSAEESRIAAEIEAERVQLIKEGKPIDHLKDGSDEKDEEEANDEVDDLEIFPEGESVALCMAEDLWPGAIRYFTQAQELDALSDEDFEDDDSEEAANED